MKLAVVRIAKYGGAFLVVVAVAAFALVSWSGGVVGERGAKVYTFKGDELAPFKGEVDLNLGKRIAEVRAGCVECHGGDLGGRPVIEDPAMGNIHGPNITPTNLAAWSDDEIGRAIRHGVSRNGRPLFLMPSTDYVGMSGGDLASLVAYIRSVPAVDRATVSVTLGPVAKVLVATGKMPNAFTAEVIDHARPLGNKPEEAPTAAFGKYLANACTGCHGASFAGGPIVGGPPDWAPAADLTPKGALASWSQDDFIKTLRTGVTPAGVTLRVPFPLALTSQMTDVELQALWAFFKALPTPSEGGLSAKKFP
jgi:cytochrome c5